MIFFAIIFANPIVFREILSSEMLVSRMETNYKVNYIKKIRAVAFLQRKKEMAFGNQSYVYLTYWILQMTWWQMPSVLGPPPLPLIGTGWLRRLGDNALGLGNVYTRGLLLCGRWPLCPISLVHITSQCRANKKLWSYSFSCSSTSECSSRPSASSPPLLLGRGSRASWNITVPCAQQAEGPTLLVPT